MKAGFKSIKVPNLGSNMIVRLIVIIIIFITLAIGISQIEININQEQLAEQHQNNTQNQIVSTTVVSFNDLSVKGLKWKRRICDSPIEFEEFFFNLSEYQKMLCKIDKLSFTKYKVFYPVRSKSIPITNSSITSNSNPTYNSNTISVENKMWKKIKNIFNK